AISNANKYLQDPSLAKPERVQEQVDGETLLENVQVLSSSKPDNWVVRGGVYLLIMAPFLTFSYFILYDSTRLVTNQSLHPVNFLIFKSIWVAFFTAIIGTLTMSTWFQWRTLSTILQRKIQVRRDVLRAGTKRLGPITPEAKAKIEAIQTVASLEALLGRIF